MDQPYQFGFKPYHAGYLYEQLPKLYSINLQTCFCKTGGSQKPAGLDIQLMFSNQDVYRFDRVRDKFVVIMFIRGNRFYVAWADPVGGGGGGGVDRGSGPPGKSQVAIGFLRNTGTDPPREAIRPKGSNCF